MTDAAADTLPARIGRRGAALLFFAFLDVVWCYGLLVAPRPLSEFYAYLNAVMPLPVWAAGWGAIGVICLVYAFRVHDTAAFMFAVGLKVAWGLSAFFGWITGEVDRGYMSTVIWLAFACFVYLIAGGIPPAVPRPSPRRWRQWIRS